MTDYSDFFSTVINVAGFSSQEEMIEKLYLTTLVNSYNRISKAIATENDIRDRFVEDFYSYESPLKKLIQLKFLFVDWELWQFNDSELGRADLCFRTTGFQFIVECKRLFHADKKYFEDGLSRFIDLKYGKGDAYGGMIGFVINQNPKVISKKISEKAKGYSFFDTSFSNKQFDILNDSYLSSHERKDKTIINIYNLFFKFSKDLPLDKDDFID
jgi:hypothetical protein